MKFLLAFYLTVFHFTHVHANTLLSSCVGSDESSWTACIGTHIYFGYAVYYGEFTSGEITGYGMHTYVNGDKYIGGHKDGRFNGRGTYIYADGRPKREGLWVEGIYSEPQKAVLRKYKASQAAHVDKINQQQGSSAEALDVQKCLRLGFIAGSDDFKICRKLK